MWHYREHLKKKVYFKKGPTEDTLYITFHLHCQLRSTYIHVHVLYMCIRCRYIQSGTYTCVCVYSTVCWHMWVVPIFTEISFQWCLPQWKTVSSHNNNNSLPMCGACVQEWRQKEHTAASCSPSTLLGPAAQHWPRQPTHQQTHQLTHSPSPPVHTTTTSTDLVNPSTPTQPPVDSLPTSTQYHQQHWPVIPPRLIWDYLYQQG